MKRTLAALSLFLPLSASAQTVVFKGEKATPSAKGCKPVVANANVSLSGAASEPSYIIVQTHVNSSLTPCSGEPTSLAHSNLFSYIVSGSNPGGAVTFKVAPPDAGTKGSSTIYFEGAVVPVRSATDLASAVSSVKCSENKSPGNGDWVKAGRSTDSQAIKVEWDCCSERPAEPTGPKPPVPPAPPGPVAPTPPKPQTTGPTIKDCCDKLKNLCTEPPPFSDEILCDLKFGLTPSDPIKLKGKVGEAAVALASGEVCGFKILARQVKVTMDPKCPPTSRIIDFIIEDGNGTPCNVEVKFNDSDYNDTQADKDGCIHKGKATMAEDTKIGKKDYKKRDKCPAYPTRVVRIK